MYERNGRRRSDDRPEYGTHDGSSCVVDNVKQAWRLLSLSSPLPALGTMCGDPLALRPPMARLSRVSTVAHSSSPFNIFDVCKEAVGVVAVLWNTLVVVAVVAVGYVL